MMEHHVIRRRLAGLDAAIEALTDGWATTCQSGPVSVWTDGLSGDLPEEAEGQVTTAVAVMVLKDIRKQLVEMGQMIEQNAMTYGPMEWSGSVATIYADTPPSTEGEG